MKPVTVLIANNHSLIRRAWSLILRSDHRFRVIAECNDFESTLLRAKNLQPDVIMIDVNMPKIWGVDIAPFVRRFSPASKILGVSLYTFAHLRHTLVHSNTSGYLTKSSSVRELFQALLETNAGRNYLCNEIRNMDAANPNACEDVATGLDILSIREIEVLSGILNNLSSKEIGNELLIPCRTVKKHQSRILKKLQLNNASEIISFLLNDKEHWKNASHN
jgi:DNA-binding NarL/FixJ family response regulator